MEIRWTFYFGKACLHAHRETRSTDVSLSGPRDAARGAHTPRARAAQPTCLASRVTRAPPWPIVGSARAHVGCPPQSRSPRVAGAGMIICSAAASHGRPPKRSVNRPPSGAAPAVLSSTSTCAPPAASATLPDQPCLPHTERPGAHEGDIGAGPAGRQHERRDPAKRRYDPKHNTQPRDAARAAGRAPRDDYPAEHAHRGP